MGRVYKPICLMLCTVVGACASQPQPVERPRPVPARPAGPSVAALSPADYVARAASIDLLALKSSELALRRSGSPKVRQFAHSARALHEGTSAQLAFAGRRLDLPTSPTLQRGDQDMFRQLEQSGTFDATYIRQQKAIHRRALDLHTNYQQRGSSPTLRAVANFAAGRLREQQRDVDAL